MRGWAEDRFPSVALGYTAASVSAGLSLTAQMIVSETRLLDEIDFILLLGLYATLFSAVLAVPFAAVLISVAEKRRIRSVFYYTIAGGIVGVLALLVLARGYEGIDLEGLRTMSVGGFVAGLVYWLIAGRNAGVIVRARS